MRENMDQKKSEYGHFSRSGIKLLCFILTKKYIQYLKGNVYQKEYVSNLGIKFHFEQKILNFGTKYARNRYIQAKMKKNEYRHWILCASLVVTYYIKLFR